MASENRNPVVFFDISIAGSHKGRIEMELRADVVPKTAEVSRETPHILHCRTSLFTFWTA